jgi:hypothetical protein
MTVQPANLKSRAVDGDGEAALGMDHSYLELDSVSGGSRSDEKEIDEQELVVRDKEELGGWDVTVVQGWEVTSQRGNVTGPRSKWDVSSPR